MILDMDTTRVRADCTVRAVAAVTGEAYADVALVMARDGYRPGRGFDLGRWLSCQCAPVIGEPEYVLGWRADWISLPARKGEARETAETFAAAHSSGRFVLKQARHVVAVVEGRVEMETRREGACVYGAWMFTRIGVPA